MLDGGTTVTGGTLLIHVDFPTSNVEGLLEIGTGGATLDKVTVENNNILQIDDGTILTLTGGAAIDGGTTNDGTVSGTILIPGAAPAFGHIDVAGSSSINGSVIDNFDGTITTIDASLNNGYVTVEHGVTLTLDNVMVNGTIFNDVDATSIIQIDDGTTLTLNDVTINGGTINDGKTSSTSDPAVMGNLDITGTSTISNAILNNGQVTIESGVTLTLHSDTVTGTAITFVGTEDTLKINSSSNFNGTIAGMGAGDAIDLVSIAYSLNEYAVWTQATSADGGSGTLKVYDGAGTLESTLSLTGVYSQNEFTLTKDDSATGGTDVNVNVAVSNEAIKSVDNFAFASGPAASSTIVASTSNQTFSGFATHDNFVFNFSEVGHATVADFHPATDTLQFTSPIFANAQAALNATHDDGHGNTIIAIDAHDTITLDGVLKAQLHTTDFHIV